MNLKNISLGFTLILAQFLTHIFISVLGNGNTSYVQDACSVTTYPDICIHSLASFSDRAKHNTTLWARAAVSVSIDRAKNVCRYLKKLETNNSMRGRNKVALLDCIDCFEDLIHHLHKSLVVLRKLNRQDFFDQIDDVTTWVSTALTDEDTCLDGFGNRIGKRINFLCDKVINTSYITSNALALVNKLAISGITSLNP